MTQGITDLRQLERDAFRRYYEDGLFDIIVGSWLAVLAASVAIADWLQDEVLSDLAMVVLGAVIVVPLLVARRRLLRARLGTFKPGPHRRRRIARTRWVLLASVFLGIVVFGVATVAHSGAASLDILETFVPLLWFINAVAVFGAMAYFLEVPRFFVYGLLLGSVMPLLVWPDVLWGVRFEAWAVLATLALAIIGIGLYKLRHFLQRYPAPQAG